MSKPKVSLKQLLVGMGGVAVILGLVSLAVQGNVASLGFVLSLVVLAIMLVVYQIVFFALSFIAQSWGRRNVVRDSELPKEVADS